jgi:hypothetical protein
VSTTAPDTDPDPDPPALRRCRLVARALDDAVRVPGTSFRVGIDPLLGLLPIAGDTVTALASLYVVVEAARLGAPGAVLVRMLLNLALDLVAGSVPVVGDLFDAVWKANSRNVALLERHLDRA